MRLHPICLRVACAALMAAAPAAAQLEDLPRRQPKGGFKTLVEIHVPWSTIGLGDGRRERFEGVLAIYPPDPAAERDLQLFSDMTLYDAEGNAVAPPAGVALRLNPQREPAGGAEPALTANEVPRDLRFRLLSSTDFGLVPARMLFRHTMPSGSGSQAERNVSEADFDASWRERFLGVETVSRTPVQKFESRVLRTFKPSGWQLLDYTMTFEDERDDTVLCAFGVRMLIHPGTPLPDGRAAPAGVHHIALVRSYQLDWLKQRPVIGQEEWEPHLERWFDRLADQLFFALDLEGIADPFDSPSAFALRALQVFEVKALARLTSAGSAKALAAIAPQLMELPLAYDPAPFAAKFQESADPVVRLLLAAAAAAAGHADPAYLRAARVALCSRDVRVLRAACRLARALDDPSLVPDLEQALSRADDEDVQVQGRRSLGLLGGAAAKEALLRLAALPATTRVKAATFRALADLGDPALDELFTDANARFGAVTPETGLFDVIIADPELAAEALRAVRRMASAVRQRDVDALLPILKDALRHETSDQVQRIAMGNAAREWLVRMGALVPQLRGHIQDPKVRDVARRVVRAAGRTCVEAVLRELRQARDAKLRTELAVLAGCTRDPRARAFLMRMQDSDALEDFEVGSAGLSAMDGDRDA